ncbi:MAG: hypothetical protein U0353_11650 [Sandaracinus sp.]
MTRGTHGVGTSCGLAITRGFGTSCVLAITLFVVPPRVHAQVAHGADALDGPSADPSSAPAAAYDDDTPTRRSVRRFSLLAGAGFSHGDSGESFSPELGFYGRLTDWASIGLRLRGGLGVSSLEGTSVGLALAAPSVRLHFREDLSWWASLELGLHVDGGLALDWRESRRVGSDRVLFGLGVGAFVTLELGEVSSVCLDYTLTSYGLGGTDVTLQGSVTLSYVARFD